MNEARYGFTDQELQAVVPQLEAMKSVAADVLWRLQVKRTPELPEFRQWVLFWHIKSWVMAQYATYASGQAVWWIDDRSYDVQDGQYWLPLPTFDPREVQE